MTDIKRLPKSREVDKIEIVAKAIAKRRLFEGGATPEEGVDIRHLFEAMPASVIDAEFDKFWLRKGELHDKQRAAYRADAKAALDALTPAPQEK